VAAKPPFGSIKVSIPTMVGPARAVAAKWVCEMADLVATCNWFYPKNDQQQKSKRQKK